MESASDDEPKPDKERPRDLIRGYIRREIGSLDAWQTLCEQDGERVPSQMVDNRRALLAMENLLLAIEGRPEVERLLGTRPKQGKRRWDE